MLDQTARRREVEFLPENKIEILKLEGADTSVGLLVRASVLAK